MSDDATRTATVTWTDPAPALADLAALPGLEYLRRMQEGTVPPPPIASLFGFVITAVEKGRVVAEVEPREMFSNPLGSIHGGFACTLLDTVLACAGHTTLAAGTGYTSIDLDVKYLRPIQPGVGRLTATGRVAKGGRRVIFTEGELTDAAGRAYASATSSLLLLN